MVKNVQLEKFLLALPDTRNGMVSIYKKRASTVWNLAKKRCHRLIIAMKMAMRVFFAQRAHVQLDVCTQETHAKTALQMAKQSHLKATMQMNLAICLCAHPVLVLPGLMLLNTLAATALQTDTAR